MNTHLSDLHIENPTYKRELEARNLILDGFLDYFDSLDHSLNLDVYNLMEYYSQPPNIFKVGLIHSKIVGTGGLIIGAKNTAHIVRISVASQKQPYSSSSFIIDMILCYR